MQKVLPELRFMIEPTHQGSFRPELLFYWLIAMAFIALQFWASGGSPLPTGQKSLRSVLMDSLAFVALAAALGIVGIGSPESPESSILLVVVIFLVVWCNGVTDRPAAKRHLTWKLILFTPTFIVVLLAATNSPQLLHTYSALSAWSILNVACSLWCAHDCFKNTPDAAKRWAKAIPNAQFFWLLNAVSSFLVGWFCAIAWKGH